MHLSLSDTLPALSALPWPSPPLSDRLHPPLPLAQFFSDQLIAVVSNDDGTVDYSKLMTLMRTLELRGNLTVPLPPDEVRAREPSDSPHSTRALVDLRVRPVCRRPRSSALSRSTTHSIKVVSTMTIGRA